MGKKAKISQYDLYIDKDTKRVWIYKKGGKGTPIPTEEFIK
ncbi:polymorphic toxin type 33 domain-containing protein [Rossellomorea aquimaris]|nr:polymorphic toxin type 33 domain-containing protein [Rossellomorea aquimaris]WRP07407.1 polymorphic toxin type 33 domain-containing protein [Rossellomorea aquimaris]